jgi:hypothetical protein
LIGWVSLALWKEFCLIACAGLSCPFVMRVGRGGGF